MVLITLLISVLLQHQIQQFKRIKNFCKIFRHPAENRIQSS